MSEELCGAIFATAVDSGCNGKIDLEACQPSKYDYDEWGVGIFVVELLI